MTRSIVLATALSVSLAAVSRAAELGRPNMIIFLADDLGYGDLGCYGHPRIRTPNLDAFARQGVRLTQCYAASAVCSPSRSAILTGRTPHRNGVFTWITEGSEVHLRTSEIALPKLLRSAGYATAHVGKWHLNGKFNDPVQPQPGDHGYDHWMATQNNAAPSHKDPANFVRDGTPVGPLAGFSAPLVADEAIRWLTSGRDARKPFFLTVWTHEPHLPIETDPQFQEPYRDLPEDFRQHHGNVSQLDHAFGRLMRTLDDLKLADSTFVFFTSDNGPEGDGLKGRSRGSTGGLRGRKRSLYEGGIRVPGIARWPGRLCPGTTIDIPVIGTDLFPTVLGLCSVRPPADRVIDGANILGVLSGWSTSVDRPRPLYWRLNMAPLAEDLHMVLRDGDWKLLASQDFKHLELYDLKADPRETTDLKAKVPTRFQDMKKRLEALNAEIEHEGPDWWKRLSPNGGGPLKP
jgi:arylsulfatase A